MLAAVTLLTVALWVLRWTAASKGHVGFIMACAGALWFTVFVGLWWFLFAVPSTPLVQGFVVLEIVLALIFAYDFFRSLRSTSPKEAGFSEAVKP